MDNDEAILNELKNIIDESGDKVQAEFDKKPLEQFVEIEKNIFQQFGYDNDSYLFSMEMIANSIKEVDELKKSNTIHAIGLDPQEIHNRAMRVSVMGSGELFPMLGNLYESFKYADNDNNVGLIVRSGVYVSKTAKDLGIEPSKADDRENGVITVLCTGDEITTLCRVEGSTEVDTHIVKCEDIEPGDEKLLDALMHFYFLPRMLKDSRPNIFKALMKDYGKQDNNNQNNKGEIQ